MWERKSLPVSVEPGLQYKLIEVKIVDSLSSKPAWYTVFSVTKDKSQIHHRPSHGISAIFGYNNGTGLQYDRILQYRRYLTICGTRADKKTSWVERNCLFNNIFTFIIKKIFAVVPYLSISIRRRHYSLLTLRAEITSKLSDRKQASRAPFSSLVPLSAQHSFHILLGIPIILLTQRQQHIYSHFSASSSATAGETSKAPEIAPRTVNADTTIQHKIIITVNT